MPEPIIIDYKIPFKIKMTSNKQGNSDLNSG